MTRGRGRGRGRAPRRRAAVLRAVKQRDFEFKIFSPPMRQPTVNRCFRFPFTCMIEQVLNETNVSAIAWNSVPGRVRTTGSTLLCSIETVILVLKETVDLPGSFAQKITYSPQKVMVYGQYEAGPSGSTATPLFNLSVFDSLTESTVKDIAVQGTQVLPARTAVDFPEVVSGHLFQWDGTTGTSAPLVGIKTTQKILISVYFTGVVTISKDLLTTADFNLFGNSIEHPESPTPSLAFGDFEDMGSPCPSWEDPG